MGRKEEEERGEIKREKEEEGKEEEKEEEEVAAWSLSIRNNIWHIRRNSDGHIYYIKQDRTSIPKDFFKWLMGEIQF